MRNAALTVIFDLEGTLVDCVPHPREALLSSGHACVLERVQASATLMGWPVAVGGGSCG